MVNYLHVSANTFPNDSCGICLDDFDNKRTILAHPAPDDNTKLVHPLHQECIKTWFLANAAKCIYCQTPINEASVITLTDKIKDEIPKVVRDGAINFVATAAIFGWGAMFGSHEYLSLVPTTVAFSYAAYLMMDGRNENPIGKIGGLMVGSIAGTEGFGWAGAATISGVVGSALGISTRELWKYYQGQL